MEQTRATKSTQESKTTRHTLLMDNRANLSLTGIVDVLSFDEETIVTESQQGVLIISGKDLHVVRLNLEVGELEIDGHISNLAYEDESIFKQNKSTFFGKIFK